MPILRRIFDSSILYLSQHIIFQNGPHISTFSPPIHWHIACSWVHVPIGAPSMQNQPSISFFDARCHSCPISDGYGQVLPSQITNNQTPTSQATTFQLRDSSNADRLLPRPRQGSSLFIHIICRSEKLVVLAGSISIC